MGKEEYGVVLHTDCSYYNKRIHVLRVRGFTALALMPVAFFAPVIIAMVFTGRLYYLLLSISAILLISLLLIFIALKIYTGTRIKSYDNLSEYDLAESLGGLIGAHNASKSIVLDVVNKNIISRNISIVFEINKSNKKCDNELPVTITLKGLESAVGQHCSNCQKCRLAIVFKPVPGTPLTSIRLHIDQAPEGFRVKTLENNVIALVAKQIQFIPEEISLSGRISVKRIIPAVDQLRTMFKLFVTIIARCDGVSKRIEGGVVEVVLDTVDGIEEKAATYSRIMKLNSELALSPAFSDLHKSVLISALGILMLHGVIVACIVAGLSELTGSMHVINLDPPGSLVTIPLGLASGFAIVYALSNLEILTYLDNPAALLALASHIHGMRDILGYTYSKILVDFIPIMVTLWLALSNMYGVFALLAAILYMIASQKILVVLRPASRFARNPSRLFRMLAIISLIMALEREGKVEAAKKLENCLEPLCLKRVRFYYVYTRLLIISFIVAAATIALLSTEDILYRLARIIALEVMALLVLVPIHRTFNPKKLASRLSLCVSMMLMPCKEKPLTQEQPIQHQ